MGSSNQQSTDIPMIWIVRAFFLRLGQKCFALVFSNRIWRKKTNSLKVYITFDDGPIPEVTPWVLQELDKYEARATFFCIGRNVEQNPELFRAITEKGHVVGNHTYRHIDGWKTRTPEYAEEVKETEKLVPNKIFRPPYGHLTQAQEKKLLQAGYSIIMWDVLAWDWDAQESSEDCYWRVISAIRNGSIVVFHDSQKAKSKLQKTLPRVLAYLRDNGWEFGVI